ncbi:unnamed protein product [Darwinula stevensoni]|uniref:Kelch repeat-containing protein n=1 Tax=Darwinula stevensoni TaxID=69355 RepID=A0A7R9A6E0_9CRUS|nr:unnamed protein product [Darwinula stevensoni]CAG0887510.1 unnamed protein product [Darwinula stevensoni]
MVCRLDSEPWEIRDVTHYPDSRDMDFRRSFTAIAGKLYVSGCDEMKIYDLTGNTWKKGKKPLNYAEWQASAASSSSLFNCGGCEYSDNLLYSNYYTSTLVAQQWVFRYDTVKDEWSRLRDMKHARLEAGAIHLQSSNVLHVIGGAQNLLQFPFIGRLRRRSDRHERLDLRTSSWEELKELPKGRASPALAFHKEMIVMAGGKDKFDSPNNNVWGYDIRMDSWREMPSMKKCRHRHGLISLGENLYAIGGKGEASMEVFDGRSWENVPVTHDDFNDCMHGCQMISAE